MSGQVRGWPASLWNSSTKQRLRPKPGPELPPFPVARFPFLRDPKDLSSQLEIIVLSPQNPSIWGPKEITNSLARTQPRTGIKESKWGPLTLLYWFTLLSGYTPTWQLVSGAHPVHAPGRPPQQVVEWGPVLTHSPSKTKSNLPSERKVLSMVS